MAPRLQLLAKSCLANDYLPNSTKRLTILSSLFANFNADPTAETLCPMFFLPKKSAGLRVLAGGYHTQWLQHNIVFLCAFVSPLIQLLHLGDLVYVTGDLIRNIVL